MPNAERFYPGQTTPEISERERFGRGIARRAAREGMVLLENDGILPLPRGARLALFGVGARHTIKGGTGSGDVNSRDTVSVEAGLRAAGYEIVNSEYLDAFDAAYARARLEWEAAIYAAAPDRDPMKLYQAHAALSPRLPEGLPFPTADCARADAAIFVISRTSGEGVDRHDAPGDYYLSDAERALLAQVCAACRRVIVVLNVGGVIDLDFMDAHPVSALVLMSQAGVEGGSALADLLSGDCDFCGRLTDTWARRYEDYPSSAGFSHRNGNLIEEYYADDIYVGYRYFDSFGIAPRYPFGYGLSYARFEQEALEARLEGTEVLIEVRVRNAGEVPGRQVIQLYASCPAQEQSKELKRLVAFGKTGALAPGEAQILQLRFGLEALASYRPGRAAWFMERGNYVLLMGVNTADCAPVAALHLNVTTNIEQVESVCELLDALNVIAPEADRREALLAGLDALSQLDIDEAVAALAARAKPSKSGDPLLVRAIEIARQMSDEEKVRLVVGARSAHSREEIGGAAHTVPGAAGETVGFPEHGIPGMVLADGPAGLRLQQRYEIDPESGEIYALSPFETMENRFFGKMPTHAGAISRYQFATAIPVGTLLAQSFDPALLEEVGEMLSGELRVFGVAVWLAPGMNLHRNPLCGRSFEYYSEDPTLSGVMAAAITKGVQCRGDVGVCVKHFACNNQEDNRFHVTAVISERALRELYLKGFEIAIKTAQPMSIMTSYNRVNGVHSANSRELCDTVARGEWGFEGFIMTDWTTTNRGHGSSAAKCILAGNDLIMPGTEGDRLEILAALRGEGDRPLPPEKLEISAARLIRAALATRSRG